VASLSISTAPTVCDSFDGTWVVRTVSNRVEFVLDASGVSSLVVSTDVGLAQGYHWRNDNRAGRRSLRVRVAG
jgi:hypothetical protein